MKDLKINSETPMMYLSTGQLKDIIKEIVEQALESHKPEIEAKNSIGLYTLSEAAQHLKMAESTLRVYIKNSEITGSRLSKRWMFTQENLDNFITRFLVKSTYDLKKERGL